MSGGSWQAPRTRQRLARSLPIGYRRARCGLAVAAQGPKGTICCDRSGVSLLGKPKRACLQFALYTVRALVQGELAEIGLLVLWWDG